MMGPVARNAAESDDFLQGVFVALVAGWDRYEIRSDGNLLALATEIARNCIRDEVRRRRERAFSAFSASGIIPSSDGSALSSRMPAEDKEAHQALAEAIERLSDVQRQVIELRHLEQLSFADIGERMSRSENAVQLLHMRALSALGAQLRDGSAD